VIFLGVEIALILIWYQSLCDPPAASVFPSFTSIHVQKKINQTEKTLGLSAVDTTTKEQQPPSSTLKKKSANCDSQNPNYSKPRPQIHDRSLTLI